MSKPSTPRTIGLAGGIGSGKSAVARILADLGCVVAHSDEAGRACLRDPEIRNEIVRWWGPEMLDASGEIDRRAVARIVFADEAARRRLETLTHPWIETRRRELFENAGPDVTALVIDAPLLFEAGLERECDAVIFVDTSRATRLERVQSTRGWDEAELTAREESQLPLDAKRSRADYVLQNDGDFESLTESVRRILNEIITREQAPDAADAADAGDA